jgi:hypothetical protein
MILVADAYCDPVRDPVKPRSNAIPPIEPPDSLKKHEKDGLGHVVDIGLVVQHPRSSDPDHRDVAADQLRKSGLLPVSPVESQELRVWRCISEETANYFLCAVVSHRDSG